VSQDGPTTNTKTTNPQKIEIHDNSFVITYLIQKNETNIINDVQINAKTLFIGLILITKSNHKKISWFCQTSNKYSLNII